jgi:membrane protease YdiL (CAAX protease family)
MENLLQFISTYILVPQADAASEELRALVGRINEQLINPLIVLLFSVGLILFVVGLYNFFGNKDDAESLEKGKRHMLWGIIGMAIMVSVFGVMKFITGSLGISDVTSNVNQGGTGDVSGLIQNN